ncbi:MAG: right-handed parallel beta-helix repeat-containing protein, partial [Myxococcales bacterium]|nr:right-handed parallel beta-helix repeat-containing protein [Myxococcales bacterium]
MRLGIGTCALLGSLIASPALAQNASTAGTATAPHPTLENISLEWAITGDADNDGVVKVRYRKTGSGTWLDGLPLVRVPAGSNQGFSWQNRHAGSVFGLLPGVSYDVELTLTDPDGGNATKTLAVTTRQVPAAAPGAAIKNVTPSSFASTASGAKAGDVLLLGDGSYATFTFQADGSQAAPIVIRAANAGKAVIDGDVRLDGRKWVIVEGLTVNGKIKLNDALGVAIKGCTVNTKDDGIIAYGPGSTDGYFCDNVVIGSTSWNTAAVGANGANLGEGIAMTGPGNVICHNKVKGFRDCISTLEDSGAINQTSIDIYGNDLDVCADDAVEADFTMGNTRVYRNRAVNSFVGMSSQPSLGGPAYFIRNVMFNIIYSPFKLHRGSIGDVAFHNTVVKCGDAFAVYASDSWARAWFRNNLFIGGTGGGTFGGYGNGDGDVLSLSAAALSCSFDYDGLGSIGTSKFTGTVSGQNFASLAELKSKTSEKNAVQVDLGVFATSVTFPGNPFPSVASPDLSLKAGAAAVDKGEKLANVNDGFAGTAPDLGAYELGAQPPTYGPRTGGSGGAAGSGGSGGSAAGGGGGAAGSATG